MKKIKTGTRVTSVVGKYVKDRGVETIVNGGGKRVKHFSFAYHLFEHHARALEEWKRVVGVKGDFKAKEQLKAAKSYLRSERDVIKFC